MPTWGRNRLAGTRLSSARFGPEQRIAGAQTESCTFASGVKCFVTPATATWCVARDDASKTDPCIASVTSALRDRR